MRSLNFFATCFIGLCAPKSIASKSGIRFQPVSVFGVILRENYSHPNALSGRHGSNIRGGIKLWRVANSLKLPLTSPYPFHTKIDVKLFLGGLIGRNVGEFRKNLIPAYKVLYQHSLNAVQYVDCI